MGRGGPWSVREAGGEVVLAVDAGLRAPPQAGDTRQASVWHLEALVRRATGDERLRRVLLEVHEELHGGFDARRGPPASLGSDLVAAVQAGRLVVARRRTRAVALLLDESPEPDVLGPASSATVDWLEIKVVDSDGKPVPGVLYAVTTSDGSTQEGRVDKKGFARLEGLKAGTCTVTFPEVDRAEIQAM